MRNYVARNVDDYIASSPLESRQTLIELRKVIKSTIPVAEESISWGVPFYKYHGLLAGFSVFTNHVSFGLAFMLSDQDHTMFEEKGYKTGSKTVQIRFDQKVPNVEISQMLEIRAEINKLKKP